MSSRLKKKRRRDDYTRKNSSLIVERFLKKKGFPEEALVDFAMELFEHLSELSRDRAFKPSCVGND